MQLQLVLCRYLLQTGSFYLVWCQIFFKNYNNLERIDQRYYFTHLFLNLSAIKTCKLLTLVRPSVRFGHLKKTTHFVLKNNQQKTIPNVIQGLWHIIIFPKGFTLIINKCFETKLYCICIFASNVQLLAVYSNYCSLGDCSIR